MSVVIALVSIGYGIGGSTDLRSRAVGYGLLNLGFAVVNVALGFLVVRASRAA